MKKIISRLGMLLIISFLFVSCEDDALGDPGGGQTQDLASRFLGTWNVDDQPSRLNYIVEIKRHELYEDHIKMHNFADLGSIVDGIIVGNTVVVEKQPAGSGYSSEGTGLLIESDKLSFEFLLDDGIDVVSREATFTK